MERLFNAICVEIVDTVSHKIPKVVKLLNHNIHMGIMVHVVRQTS